MNPIQNRCEEEVGRILTAAGIQFKNLTDVPVRTIRLTMRGAVPGMRVTQLAPDLRETFLQQPVTGDLLCMRAGYHQAPPTHYLPRPDGSYDCIFIYCISGQGWLEINGQTWTVEKNCGFIIPRHTPHTYGADPDNPWETYWVHFQGRQADAYTEMIAPDGGNPVIHLPRHQDIAAGIEQLYQYMSQVHTYATLVAATGSLSHLLGIIPLSMRATELRSRTAEENMDKTIDFMHRNLARRLTLDELAAVAGMSANHYGTLFGKRFNSTPIDYFNRLKIQRACELLSTTRLRVGEIGEQLGYDDPFYFSRLFKKVMGVSPRDYR